MLQINNEALESIMCDVIKICLESRISTRSGKENQLLDIKTALERPIFNLGLPNIRWSYYSILLFIASLLFRTLFYDVTHDTFQCFTAFILLYEIWHQFCFIFMWFQHFINKKLHRIYSYFSEMLRTGLNPAETVRIWTHPGYYIKLVNIFLTIGLYLTTIVIKYY